MHKKCKNIEHHDFRQSYPPRKEINEMDFLWGCQNNGQAKAMLLLINSPMQKIIKNTCHCEFSFEELYHMNMIQTFTKHYWYVEFSTESQMYLLHV